MAHLIRRLAERALLRITAAQVSIWLGAAGTDRLAGARRSLHLPT